MILQFVGFFTIFGIGAGLCWWSGTELYNYFKHRFRSLWNNIPEALMLIFIICFGSGMMCYAVYVAPFEISFSLSLKN